MYSIFLAIGPLVFLVILNVFIIGASLLKSKNGSSNGDNMALVRIVQVPSKLRNSLCIETKT